MSVDRLIALMNASSVTPAFNRALSRFKKAMIEGLSEGCSVEEMCAAMLAVSLPFIECAAPEEMKRVLDEALVGFAKMRKLYPGIVEDVRKLAAQFERVQAETLAQGRA